MAGSFRFGKACAQIAREAVKADTAPLFVAETARRLMEDFVPLDTGNLRRSATASQEGDRGIVCYNADYARKQYEGSAMRHSASGVTAFWDRTMLMVRKGELVAALQSYINAT